MASVIKLQAPFEYIKISNISPEVALRRAIILQAIIDASNTSKKQSAKKIEKSAKDWLFKDSEYLHDICRDAGLEIEFVRFIATKIINYHHKQQGLKIDADEYDRNILNTSFVYCKIL